MTRILIVGPAWVGDMVMTESLVSALKRQTPDATIDLLAPPWTAPLGERMEGVAATRQIASVHGRFDLFKRMSLGTELKGENYDLAIVLPGSLKSAIAPFVARIPKRRGYVGEMRYGLLNDARRLDKKKLPRTIDRFVALAGDDGGSPPTVTPPVLRHDPAAARAIAAKLGLVEESRPVVALCPGAEYGPAKQWPATHFAALAALLCRSGLCHMDLRLEERQADCRRDRRACERASQARRAEEPLRLDRPPRGARSYEPLGGRGYQ